MEIYQLIGNEIVKYSKYLLPISIFTEKIYDDAMEALNKFDETEDEIQISQKVSIVNNNLDIQKLKELYTMYGVDRYYLEPSSALSGSPYFLTNSSFFIINPPSP